MLNAQRLPKLGRFSFREADRFALLTDSHYLQTARLGMVHHAGIPAAIARSHPHDCGRIVSHNLVEEPHLGGEIVFHIRVVIEMIAAEIGEARSFDGHALVAELRETMARRFESHVCHTFTRQAAQVRQECDNIRGGQTGGDATIGGGDAQRTDARGPFTCHTPDLASHFDSRGFPVRTCYRHDMLRYRGEVPRRQRCKGTARCVVGDVDGTIHDSFGPSHNRDRAAFYRCGNEILAIDLHALKRTENRSRGNLAIVDRETRHIDVGVARDPRSSTELGQLHRLASGISGLMSEMSTSRVSSGRTPMRGPMRGTRRPTIGAAFHAAVR